jgi:phosphoserine phosphatase
MPSPLLSRDEIAKLGQELYDRHIRAQVEVAENIGKIVSIDIETGEYEVGDELVETSLRSQSKHPRALLWAEKIGFDAVYAVGGTIIRTVDL